MVLESTVVSTWSTAQNKDRLCVYYLHLLHLRFLVYNICIGFTVLFQRMIPNLRWDIAFINLFQKLY